MPYSQNTVALWAALYHGHTEQALAAIQAGANVDARDKEGRTALHYAAAQGNAALVRALLDAGADPNARAISGHTALQLVGGRTSNTEILRLLATTPGVQINEPDRRGWTPLLSAVYARNTAAVRILLDAGANPNQTALLGRSALHIGVAHGNREIVQLLLGAGADPNQADDFGDTPLHDARAHQQIIIADLLLDAGADISLVSTENKSYRGWWSDCQERRADDGL